MNSSVTAIILAAGKGTRMKSSKAKVLHQVFFKPMLHHVLDTVHQAAIDHCVVIVGHQKERVVESLQGYEVTPVVQEEQLGTGHAVLSAESACRDAGLIMILCGDSPLIRPEILTKMIGYHRRSEAGLTLMTTLLDEPFGYGRIISKDDGSVAAIVEEKDATAEQRKIREVNAGIYLADRQFLFSALQGVGTDNAQGEVYLTDIVAIANDKGIGVGKFVHPAAIDVLGINSRLELAQAHRELQMRRNRELMLDGVTMYDPATTLVAPTVSLGRDCILYGGVQITGRSTLGSSCILEPGVCLHDVCTADEVFIGANSVLHNCQLERAEHIVPLTYRVG